SFISQLHFNDILTYIGWRGPQSRCSFFRVHKILSRYFTAITFITCCQVFPLVGSRWLVVETVGHIQWPEDITIHELLIRLFGNIRKYLLGNENASAGIAECG